MSTYSCRIAEKIGHAYSLSPEQVTPDALRQLARHWTPGGRDLSAPLRADADRLERYLRRHPDARVGQGDGREMARRALGGTPLLAELERGWLRHDAT